MDFRIASTFVDSLAKLTGSEQKVAKTTAFDLQMNPAQPGLQFHKLRKGKRPTFLVCPREPRPPNDCASEPEQLGTVLR